MHLGKSLRTAKCRADPRPHLSGQPGFGAVRLSLCWGPAVPWLADCLLKPICSWQGPSPPRGALLSHRKRRFVPQLSRKKQFALILNGACWHRELALHFPWAVTLLGFVLLSRNRCALLALVHQGPVFSTSPRNTIVIQSCIFKQFDLLGCVMDGVSGCLVLGFVVIPVRFWEDQMLRFLSYEHHIATSALLYFFLTA